MAGVSEPRPALARRIQRWCIHPAARTVVWIAGLLPLAWIAWLASTAGLGPNPAEALIRRTGLWTLRMLCLTLAVTPLRQATGWTALVRLRRPLGQLTFAWVVVHLLAYAWLDQGLDPAAVLRDVAKRPFILAGMLGFALLAPLAATSSDRAIRSLGPARWRHLHRLVWAVAVVAIIHFAWMRSGKRLYGEVWIYGSVLAALAAARGVAAVRRRR